jgi:hypothetical protein
MSEEQVEQRTAAVLEVVSKYFTCWLLEQIQLNWEIQVLFIEHLQLWVLSVCNSTETRNLFERTKLPLELMQLFLLCMTENDCHGVDATISQQLVQHFGNILVRKKELSRMLDAAVHHVHMASSWHSKVGRSKPVSNMHLYDKDMQTHDMCTVYSDACF